MSRPTSPSVSRPLVLSTLDELAAPPRPRTASLPATADPFTAHPTGSGSFVTYEPDNASMGSASPPPASVPLAMLPRRARGSLLMASGLSFVRAKHKGKKPPTPVQPSPFVFSEVIEISAPRKDDDDEERDRLRDAAAQSIGLDPVLLADERSLSEPDVPEDTRAGSSTPTPAPSAELPGFPSTRSALESFVQLQARMAKHYPPPSFLKLTLARQWKYRVLVLTSAAQGSACLHVFKTGVSDERELERLPVGVDTVVFVADEDVGGRRGVVRVGRPDGAGMDMALHMADSAQAQEWIAVIKQAVLSQRSFRAGLGLMAHSPGGVEPRGDMDVMLSMRAQGMLSSPTSSTFSPEIASAPVSQRSTSAAGTRSPSGAVSALRGLFSSPGSRPRSPSMASTRVDSEDSGSQHEDSFGRVGTSLLGMLRSQSVASERPISPVSSMSAGMVPASVPATPRQTEIPLVQPHPHLDRKILQDKDLDLIEFRPASGGTDVSALLRGRSPLSMATLRATPAPATTPPPLQPPPRRRGYTIGSTPMGARPRPDTIAGTAYTHANGSTAESFGLRAAGMSMLFASHPPPAPSSRPGSSGGQAEGKPRTSLSSVSSYASYASNERHASSEAGHSNGHVNGNANGSINAKRWSRQSILPHRLTPPEGALPAPPAPPSTHGSPRSISSLPRHPYAAESSSQSVSNDSPQSFVFNLRESSRRDTSPLSSASPQSFVLNLRDFSRRASSSSARSFSSVSTSHSRATTSNGGSFLGHRPRSSHRASMPPPQRPAPLTALPPTPASTESDSPPKSPSSAPSHKTSFRESLALRRLSLSPPSVPPSSSLPPCPDEPTYRGHGHRRSLSNASPLTPIPASPGASISGSGPAPPFPPPNASLPPTPEAHSTSFTSAQHPNATPTPQPNPQPQSRAAAFKQRIRMLSAPSQVAPLPLNLPPPSPTPSTVNPYSVPSTPIGEPIAQPSLQNDPSFVSSASMPPMPHLPLGSAFSPHTFAADDHEHGVTSLSPPPRRGSRRISRFPDNGSDDSSEKDKPRPSTADAAGDAGHRHGSLSLSSRTSAVSLINLHST
ncbi:uncharacterized protein B0H18DRAFT_1114029 [Fomitopsis serialis]|uniref:uncharacterized protein n=1 Tax=Fomitopsis serialis TaxID=139415 RepID=UPI002008DDE0|nr:uncharacterized protein B0H18DRAFT_1114029 [Neoantrodia serialis]KAH9936672.1 hypothetical protein B0H18DRAFT_1114029 [Neoantrodia serialis]